MQASNLKFPGGFTSAQTIRREVAHEISQLEISAAAGSPVDPSLALFLADAAQKCPGFEALPLPDDQTVVLDGYTVAVRNSANALIGAAATAVVADNKLKNVKLPATTAAVVTGSTVAVQNSAGAAVGTGSVTVSAGGVSNVKLPATVATVTSGLSTVAATGTGTKVTFTVANGVITGIALSA